MSINDKSVYYIKPPDEPITKYFLMVQRGSASPFGGAGQAVFAIDDLRAVVGPSQEQMGWQGLRDDGTVVCQFPVANSYMLVTREAVEVLTPAQVAQNQKEEEEELDRLFPKQKRRRDEEDEDPRPMPGQYT